jgi:small subunit ribosomal protein S2
MSIQLKELLEAGVHYGHQTRRWNPKMRPYIFGARNGIHIIDLQKTVKLFKNACQFLEDTVARGGHVLFVGTKKLSRELVEEEAKRAGMYFINYRWLGGTLTNFPTIRQSIHRLKRFEKMRADGTLAKLTKKEALGFEREIFKLEKNLGGIKDMPGVPSAVFVIDAHKEQIAVKEAVKLGIPVVAITDTNSDPTLIAYPVPGNDDSIKSIKVFLEKVADACLSGKAKSKDFKNEDRKIEVKEGTIRDEAGNKIAVEKKIHKEGEVSS